MFPSLHTHAHCDSHLPRPGTSIELKNALGGAYKVHFNVAPEVFDEDRVRRILQEHVDRFFAARADEASGSDTDTRVRVVSWSGTQVSFSLPVAGKACCCYLCVV